MAAAAEGTVLRDCTASVPGIYRRTTRLFRGERVRIDKEQEFTYLVTRIEYPTQRRPVAVRKRFVRPNPTVHEAALAEAARLIASKEARTYRAEDGKAYTLELELEETAEGDPVMVVATWGYDRRWILVPRTWRELICQKVRAQCVARPDGPAAVELRYLFAVVRNYEAAWLRAGGRY